MRVQSKRAVTKGSSSAIRRKIYLCVTALGCPYSLNNSVAALTTTSWYTMLFENANLGDIRRSTTGIFYQQGDEGESEIRLREHSAAALLYTSKVRAINADDSLRKQSSSPVSPMIRVISWATKCCKPKDDYDIYMEFLGHRHNRLHDECIVFDDHSPSLAVKRAPAGDTRTTASSSVIQRLCRLPEKQRQAIGRLRHFFTPVIKSVVWMSAQGSLLLDLQSTIPVTLAVMAILLFRPICAAAATAVATTRK